MSMRDTIKRVLDQSFGPFGDGTVDRMANYVVAALPDYDAQQARIDELEAIALAGQALAELMKSWNVEPKSVIDAALKAYAEALKGTDT